MREEAGLRDDLARPNGLLTLAVHGFGKRPGNDDGHLAIGVLVRPLVKAGRIVDEEGVISAGIAEREGANA